MSDQSYLIEPVDLLGLSASPTRLDDVFRAIDTDHATS